MTRSRYRLEFQDGEGGEPAFRAYDVVTARGQALNELSTATRVQLLLAVRIAFVETQENGVMLPLFLDETLGTSDDYRAAAIVDAVIALAEKGRQLFYFTAQRDEVAKWTAALTARDVEYRNFNLAALRHHEGSEAAELLIAPLPADVATTLPASSGHTHDSYGRALCVPPVHRAAAAWLACTSGISSTTWMRCTSSSRMA